MIETILAIKAANSVASIDVVWVIATDPLIIATLSPNAVAKSKEDWELTVNVPLVGA